MTRRHFYRARWQGAEYPAGLDQHPDRLWIRLRSPEPAEGFEEQAPGCHVRPVPVEDCQAVYSVTTVGEWRGATCQICDERDGELLVEYVGGLVPVALELGMERVERGVYRRWVPVHEVDGVRENVVLLAL
ncbi:hypothetical protein [Streptosporangium roseum]|uniref:hypothetical protein n=1 Tax=Streptosporangium roseum TaxID=2001 RepID=UPI0004CD8D11|nr:hypothetical protein [Streptosporangium roseum]